MLQKIVPEGGHEDRGNATFDKPRLGVCLDFTTTIQLTLEEKHPCRV